VYDGKGNSCIYLIVNEWWFDAYVESQSPQAGVVAGNRTEQGGNLGIPVSPEVGRIRIPKPLKLILSEYEIRKYCETDLR
jgi:hypothetical protein